MLGAGERPEAESGPGEPLLVVSLTDGDLDVAVRVGGQLFDGVFGQVQHATTEEERAALEYLARHRDKQYSFVDSLSFVVMEKLGITEALAADSDFTHRFVARPGPRPK